MTLKGRTGNWNDWTAEPDLPTKSRQLPHPKSPKNISISDIVLKGGRAIDLAKVAQFERSIEDQGFQQPIHVYRLKNSLKGKYGLAAGQHRLRALNNLGYENVSAFVITRREAKTWRSSENLYRSSLLPLQRSEDIVDYAANRENLQNVKAGKAGGKQPHERGYKELSKAIGFDRKRIAEAFLHVKLPNSVKKEILANRRMNTRQTLNLLTRIPNESEQIAYIKKCPIPLPNMKKKCQTAKPARQNAPEYIPKNLETAWENSSVRRIFDTQSQPVKSAFVKKYF